ncbi:DUF7352 domain-containing protein [Amycolatopsis sp. CA-126428]|uniref:DUF7352 domain-containing protein n=1 Tax=Amycolatopsis sp. CA-126428 TaxID=2073158 RepID=UPI000CD2E0A5|nr:hypothetical protein [Amycolatopsis sp. CA-126428]
MTTIWKYALEIADRQTLQMPAGARLLTAQLQHGHLALWAEVDPAAEPEDRTVAIVGTGNPMPAGEAEYVATAQAWIGHLVWHVFEVRP